MHEHGEIPEAFAVELDQIEREEEMLLNEFGVLERQNVKTWEDNKYMKCCLLMETQIAVGTLIVLILFIILFSQRWWPFNNY